LQPLPLVPNLIESKNIKVAAFALVFTLPTSAQTLQILTSLFT